jgi:hypothetical protein
MNTAEKLNAIQNGLDSLVFDRKTLDKKIATYAKKRDQLLLELNKENLKDPAWLFKNPTMPGADEATENLVKELYGGTFNGPHPSGYIHDEKYKPVQKNFDFWLKVYSKEDKRDLLKKNCDHFVENFLTLLEPVMEIESRWNKKFEPMKVVPFQFRSEESGLDYLGYEPVEGTWYHFTLRYGNTDIERKFKNWDEAYEFAFRLTNTDEDDE